MSAAGSNIVPTQKRPAGSVRPSLRRLPRPSASSRTQSVHVPSSQSRNPSPPSIATRSRPGAGVSAMDPGRPGSARLSSTPVSGSKRWTARPSMSSQYSRCSGTLHSGHSPRRARAGRISVAVASDGDESVTPRRPRGRRGRRRCRRRRLSGPRPRVDPT